MILKNIESNQQGKIKYQPTTASNEYEEMQMNDKLTQQKNRTICNVSKDVFDENRIHKNNHTEKFKRRQFQCGCYKKTYKHYPDKTLQRYPDIFEQKKLRLTIASSKDAWNHINPY